MQLLIELFNINYISALRKRASIFLEGGNILTSDFFQRMYEIRFIS